MEIKIDAKCPRCGKVIEFYHISDDTKSAQSYQLLDKTYDIARASSLNALERKKRHGETRKILVKKSAKAVIDNYFNDLFVDIKYSRNKKELLELKKQLMHAKIRLSKKTENNFKANKAKTIKEINEKINDLNKARLGKDKKGLAYRGLFDEKKPKK
jgi:hypothetical protein